MNRPDVAGTGGAPAPMPIGAIWQQGGVFYERTPGGVWDVPWVRTFIERDGYTELLRFGLIYRCGELAMPLLTSAGATPEEVAEARLMCWDDERYTIKRLLGLDDIEFEEMERSF